MICIFSERNLNKNSKNTRPSVSQEENEKVQHGKEISLSAFKVTFLQTLGSGDELLIVRFPILGRTHQTLCVVVQKSFLNAIFNIISAICRYTEKSNK